MVGGMGAGFGGEGGREDLYIAPLNLIRTKINDDDETNGSW